MLAYPTPTYTPAATNINNISPFSLFVMSKTAYNYRRRSSEDTIIADDAPALPDLEDDLPTNDNGEGNSPDDDEDEVSDEPMEDQSVPNVIVVQNPSPGFPASMAETSYSIHPAT
ncbi:hypothetical protein BGZ95_008610 [Linnemannia exigua]|uniref:Uncharacterized protein n=1 Tax=Linnemannia exigua TaxID=604196 RepID=A0AAD4H8E8_9FUNG|nr:hypothetical protein BGZ95_008610 [Linnemannia exigua]